MRALTFAFAACALATTGCDAVPPASANMARAAMPADYDLPALTGRVVDQANLLPPETEARLTAASSALQREIGPQFVIATVNSLGGHSIEDYGVALGRTWGIGGSERNDGILLIVAPAERKVRIEVGTGLTHRIPDPYAARVIRERSLPRFRADDFPGGIEAASDAIITRLRSRATDAQSAVAGGVAA